GGGATWLAGGQLQCHTHQKNHHRQWPSLEGTGAAHDSARTEPGESAGTTRCGRRARRCSMSLLPRQTAGGRTSMITKITGVLNRVLDEEVRLQVGALEYQ